MQHGERNPALRAARAITLVQGRMRGLTMRELAQQVQRSEETVRRELRWAEQEGLVQQYQDQILRELSPKAIAAYQETFDTPTGAIDRDTARALKLKIEAARDIHKGTGVFKDGGTSAARVDLDTIDIYDYRRLRAERLQSPGDPSLLDEAGDAERHRIAEAAAIDGEILGAEAAGDGRAGADGAEDDA